MKKIFYILSLGSLVIAGLLLANPAPAYAESCVASITVNGTESRVVTSDSASDEKSIQVFPNSTLNISYDQTLYCDDRLDSVEFYRPFYISGVYDSDWIGNFADNCGVDNATINRQGSITKVAPSTIGSRRTYGVDTISDRGGITGGSNACTASARVTYVVVEPRATITVTNPTGIPYTITDVSPTNTTATGSTYTVNPGTTGRTYQISYATNMYSAVATKNGVVVGDNSGIFLQHGDTLNWTLSYRPARITIETNRQGAPYGVYMDTSSTPTFSGTVTQGSDSTPGIYAKDHSFVPGENGIASNPSVCVGMGNISGYTTPPQSCQRIGPGSSYTFTMNYTTSSGGSEPSASLQVKGQGASDSTYTSSYSYAASEGNSTVQISLRAQCSGGSSTSGSVNVSPISTGSGTWTTDRTVNISSANIGTSQPYTLTCQNGQNSTITITRNNATPISSNDAYTVAPGSVNDFSVLSNDSDPDGHDLTISSTSLGSNGTISADKKSVRYTAPSASGTYSFSYNITDNAGGTAIATVTVTVTPSSANACLIDVTAQGSQGPYVMPLGNTARIAWDTTNATSVRKKTNPSTTWGTGALSPLDGYIDGTPTQANTFTYGAECLGPDGVWRSDSVTVDVKAPVSFSVRPETSEGGVIAQSWTVSYPFNNQSYSGPQGVGSGSFQSTGDRLMTITPNDSPNHIETVYVRVDSGSEIQASSVLVGPGQSVSFRIVYALPGTVRVTSNLNSAFTLTQDGVSPYPQAISVTAGLWTTRTLSLSGSSDSIGITPANQTGYTWRVSPTSPFTLPGNASRNVTITYTPDTSACTSPSTVRVTSNLNSAFTLTQDGVSPSPQPVAVSANSWTTRTLSLSGSSDSIGITPANQTGYTWSVSPTSPFILSCGGSQDVTITYAATPPIGDSATINVASNMDTTYSISQDDVVTVPNKQAIQGVTSSTVIGLSGPSDFVRVDPNGITGYSHTVSPSQPMITNNGDVKNVSVIYTPVSGSSVGAVIEVEDEDGNEVNGRWTLCFRATDCQNGVGNGGATFATSVDGPLQITVNSPYPSGYVSQETSYRYEYWSSYQSGSQAYARPGEILYFKIIFEEDSNPPPESPVSVDLFANPTVVERGAQSNLSWTTQNASSCVASGDWSGSKNASGGNENVTVNTDSSYTLTCSNSSGSALDTATVTIVPPNFTLYRSGEMTIDTIPGTSTPATISVQPENGFNSNVVFTIPNPPFPGRYTFSRQTLSSGQYGSGTQLEVALNSNVPDGNYSVTVQATGGGLVREISVPLLVRASSGNFDEF